LEGALQNNSQTPQVASESVETEPGLQLTILCSGRPSFSSAGLGGLYTGAREGWVGAVNAQSTHSKVRECELTSPGKKKRIFLAENLGGLGARPPARGHWGGQWGAGGLKGPLHSFARKVLTQSDS
jgi:hypothetical protein